MADISSLERSMQSGVCARIHGGLCGACAGGSAHVSTGGSEEPVGPARPPTPMGYVRHVWACGTCDTCGSCGAGGNCSTSAICGTRGTCVTCGTARTCGACKTCGACRTRGHDSASNITHARAHTHTLSLSLSLACERTASRKRTSYFVFARLVQTVERKKFAPPGRRDN